MKISGKSIGRTHHIKFSNPINWLKGEKTSYSHGHSVRNIRAVPP